MIDLEKLYEPYSKDVSLDKTIAWLAKEAASHGVSQEVMDTAIVEVFAEMAQGKTFPTTHPDFNVENASMNIYLRDHMLKLHSAVSTKMKSLLQGRIDAVLLAHIHEDNKKYTDSKMIPHRLLDWSKSPVARGVKRLWLSLQ